jgi:apolipoprotein N-acyltransferase
VISFMRSLQYGYLFTPLPIKHNSFSLFQSLLLSSLSGLLLAIPVLNPSWYIAGWVGFVPLLIALQRISIARAYFLGGFTGLILYSCTTYWIADYIHLFKGISYRDSVLWGGLFWLYCSQLIALLAIGVVWLSKFAVSDLIAFPLLSVLMFSLFPMLFSVQLGESQNQFYYAIQAVDIVGVHGLDAILALVNVLVFRLLAGERLSRCSVVLVSSTLVIWFGYGIWTFHAWQGRIQVWPNINMGFIQPNEKPTLGRYPVHPGYSKHYPPELELTVQLAMQGADWVVWPEARYKSALDTQGVLDSYRQVTAQGQVNLLFHDMAHSDEAGMRITRNKVVAINHQGEIIAEHQKNKLVPFGEYTPLLQSAPWIAEFFTDFFGEFTREIEAGQEHRSIYTDKLNIVPLICNETMHSRFVAEAVGKQPKHLLLGMSSNGWFGNTLQPYQHASTSVLRAVENRLTFLHVLNNGPSLAVLPTGEALFQAEYGVAGGYLFAAPYPAEGNTTVYSRNPNVFMHLIYLASGLVGIWCLLQVKAPRQKKKNVQNN